MKFVHKLKWDFDKNKTFPILQNLHRTRRTIPKWMRKVAIFQRFSDENYAVSLSPSGKFLETMDFPVHRNAPKFLQKTGKETFMSDGTFYQAVGSVLLMAEFFALMPVKGVKSTSPTKLSFSWWNLRTIYSVAFIAYTMFDMCLAMRKIYNETLTINHVEPIIFRVAILIVSLNFLNLSKKWPKIMMTWDRVEKDLPQYNCLMDKQRMAYQIKMVTFVLMIVSLVEHLLNMISIIHTANYCQMNVDPIKSYFIADNYVLFSTVPFSFWLGWLGKMQHFVSSFIWNYMDVFVIIMSIGLSSKFKQINDNLKQFNGMQMPEYFWSERRVQYQNICVLCRIVDDAISVITLMSFSNNLYFICIQLLKSLKNFSKMPTFAHALYFYFSLAFLFGRTLAVSLYAANVHDESKKPLRYLRYVPKESWYPETKRFAEEISNDLVALSGMKFFHLTRKLVLSVAGTIVTYELVLIQFHEDSSVNDC